MSSKGLIFPNVFEEEDRIKAQQVEEENYDKLDILKTQDKHIYEEGYTEDIHTDKLAFIVANRHIFEPLMLKDKPKDIKLSKGDSFVKAEKMLNKSRNGISREILCIEGVSKIRFPFSFKIWIKIYCIVAWHFPLFIITLTFHVFSLY